MAVGAAAAATKDHGHLVEEARSGANEPAGGWEERSVLSGEICPERSVYVAADILMNVELFFCADKNKASSLAFLLSTFSLSLPLRRLQFPRIFLEKGHSTSALGRVAVVASKAIRRHPFQFPYYFPNPMLVSVIIVEVEVG